MRRPKSNRMRLPSGHGWRAKANHKILVLGRGAVRLEYPVAIVSAIAETDRVRRRGATAEVRRAARGPSPTAS